jgi:hypothetical protein
MRRCHVAAGLLAIAGLLAACEGQINARLDNSIGLATYENIGLIERKPLGIGLVVDEALRTAKTEVVTKNIRYHMAVGEALTSRLMYALVLQFERVQLLSEPALPDDRRLDAVMLVSLKDLDASVAISPKWTTVATESSGWIEVEAVLKDRNNQIVWVGTSRAEAEAEEQSIGMAGAQDAGSAMNVAIERTVAKLVAQMAESGSLRDFIAQYQGSGS